MPIMQILLKSLANKARKEMVNSGKIAYSSSAKATYQNEVDSLMGKLNVALKECSKRKTGTDHSKCYRFC